MQALRSMTAGLCLAAILMWWSPPGARAQEADLGKAKENYQSYCRKCHGDSGNGDGPGAAMLNPKPRAFSDCKEMDKHPDAEMFKVISEGGEAAGFSADMQPWGGTLSDTEIRDLIKFVRSFCKKS